MDNRNEEGMEEAREENSTDGGTIGMGERILGKYGRKRREEGKGAREGGIEEEK